MLDLFVNWLFTRGAFLFEWLRFGKQAWSASSQFRKYDWTINSSTHHELYLISSSPTVPEQLFKTLQPLIIVMTEQSTITSFGGLLHVQTLQISCWSTYFPPSPHDALMVSLLLCGVALCCCVAIKINCASESFACTINFISLAPPFYSVFRAPSFAGYWLSHFHRSLQHRCARLPASTHLYVHVHAHIRTGSAGISGEVWTDHVNIRDCSSAVAMVTALTSQPLLQSARGCSRVYVCLPTANGHQRFDVVGCLQQTP